MRKIIHIDMDAFFASVEQRDNPEYKGKPIAVGGLSSRGVVAAASYEARKYGVYSAMPSKTAKKKCPFIIFVRPRFDVYKQVSKQIMEIFLEYTDLVEPLSLDEAFLDVTTHKKGKPSATLIAKEIKERIKNETGLTASAGVSTNKFLAKIASDYKKPDGLFLIKPEEAEKFVEELPIEKFFGVGKVTAQKMHKLNITLGKDLKKLSEYELIKKFGKQGAYFYNICRAIDNREVKPDRLRKSVGAENTFETDISNINEIESELINIAETLFKRIEKVKLYGKTITIKIKFSDFKIITRSKTVGFEINSFESLKNSSLDLLRNENLENTAIRLIGISVSNFSIINSNFPIQLTFDF
ncbi:MAG: DNA polymerase IV [Bacteroidales bacterium]|nr:DNA polymerase IV [Bacteroidales bacterium]MBN2758346.1 DNA polymerase IV [Bacteroidales bacterium]